MKSEPARLLAIALPVVFVAGLGVWLAGQGVFGPRFGAAASQLAPGPSSPPPAAPGASPAPSASAAPAALVEADSPTIDAPGSKVTLVEFLDFECEACGAAYPTVKRILADYGGRLRYVVRDFPNHANSALAASAAYAAAEQGKYWQMYDLLFQRQTTWAERQDSQAAVFIRFAEELGLDMAKFRTDLESGRYVDRLRRDFDSARALGVDATPTFFVNGVKSVGVMTYEELKQRIEDAIAAAS